MAEKTYIVKVGKFGHLRNREVIDKAALEGRTVPPVVDYLEEGAEVQLDSTDDHTKKALDSGAIEEKSKASKSSGDS